MIIIARKRLIFWLLRAYLRRWGKTIVVSFILGLFIFSIIFFNRNFLISKLSFAGSQSIGIAGIYSKQDFPNNLPDVVLNQISRGLTKVNERGQVQPDVAQKWEVKDDGKTFIFYLKQDVVFSDGKHLDSSQVNYNFENVTIEKPTKQIVVFKLKNKYSPFLVTLANHKIFKKNFVGVSDYSIKKIKENGGFIDYIELYSQKDKKTIKYDFYDNQELLKSAYVLGEVSKAIDIVDISYQDKIDLSKFKNTNISKNTNEDKIVTIFFDNQDPLLSDKKVRKALAYSLPNTFPEGKRVYTPYKIGFWANNPTEIYQKDIEFSNLLLKESQASTSGRIKITLKTLPQYKKLAESIAQDWKKINFETKIEVSQSVPDFYQAFLGDLPVLKDPDEYTLWHTGQNNNITHYKNLRIDKLLEDGRTTYEEADRKKIYTDFQKYLVDDMPATFLYLPYTYTLLRK